MSRAPSTTYQKMIDREALTICDLPRLERAAQILEIVSAYKQAVEQLWPDLNHDQESVKYATALCRRLHEIDMSMGWRPDRGAVAHERKAI